MTCLLFTVDVCYIPDTVYLFCIGGVQSRSCDTYRDCLYILDIYFYHWQLVHGKLLKNFFKIKIHQDEVKDSDFYF
jgi:hypothetical protein